MVLPSHQVLFFSREEQAPPLRINVIVLHLKFRKLFSNKLRFVGLFDPIKSKTEGFHTLIIHYSFFIIHFSLFIPQIKAPRAQSAPLRDYIIPFVMFTAVDRTNLSVGEGSPLPQAKTFSAGGETPPLQGFDDVLPSNPDLSVRFYFSNHSSRVTAIMRFAASVREARCARSLPEWIS